MRSWSKLALSAILVAGLATVPAPVASETAPAEEPTLVDFRMAPVEQALKIHRHLHPRPGPGETLTVMSWDGTGDGRHLVVPASQAKPDYLVAQFSGGGFDSVSWPRPAPPAGSCDSKEECEDRVDEMCQQAGHGGVNSDTVVITMHADGSKTCSGDCNSHGAVAFVTCNPR